MRTISVNIEREGVFGNVAIVDTVALDTATTRPFTPVASVPGDAVGEVLQPRPTPRAISVQPRGAHPQLHDVAADFIHVGGVRYLLHVVLQILQGCSETLQLDVDQTAVAHLGCLAGRDCDDPIYGREGADVVALIKVDALQVTQHACEDFPLVRSHQHCGDDRPRYFAATRLAQPLLQVLETQGDAAAVGIDDDHTFLQRAFDE